MRTDQPVEVLFNQSKLTGTGMVANNATREVKILGDTKAIYQPPTSR